MLKFLRRYNKWILAVFGTLLLLVFLVPSTLTELTRRSAILGGTWAHLDGAKVTEASRMNAAAQLELLATYQQLIGSNDLDRIRAMTGLDRDPAHWYLLVHEADKAGFVGGPEEGRRWLQDQLTLGNSPLTEAQFVGRLAGAAKQTPTQVVEALANMRGVLRMLSVAGALPISDNRAKLAASEAQMSAACDLGILDARTPLPGETIAAPTDEQIRAQFEKYRDTVPGTGERGFGYRVPDRLKLEWMRVPVDAVRASVADDPRLGSLELRKAYLKEPESYLAPSVAGGYPDFDTVEEQIKAAILDRITRERLLDINRFVEDQAALALRGAVRRGGYLDLTPEMRAKQPTFDQLAKAISEQFRIPVPEVTAAGDTWIEPQAAATIPGLGGAMTTRFGTQPRRTAELLKALREFGGSPTLIVQEGVLSPPLFAPAAKDAPSDLFFFRVVAAQATHAPANLDEVIDLVRTDLLRLARYEQLVTMQPELLQKAIANGVQATAKEFGGTGSFAPRISEFSNTLPGLGPTPTAAKAIIEVAMKLPRTAPVADLPDADRTLAVAVPEKLALVLARITNISPMSAEDFQMYASAGMVQRLIEPKVPGIKLPDLFSYDALAKRYDFKLSRGDGPTQDQ